MKQNINILLCLAVGINNYLLVFSWSFNQFNILFVQGYSSTKFIVLRHYRRSERTTTNYKRLLLLIALLRCTHEMYHRPALPLHIAFHSVCFNSILFSKRSFLVQIKVWLIRSKTSGQLCFRVVLSILLTKLLNTCSSSNC